MSSWPLASDYALTLQNPQVAFKDAQLMKCSIKKDKNGQPFGMSGNFAVVYQGERPSGERLALRAFTSSNAERKDRYDLISEYLDTQQRLKCLVDFKYYQKGIRAKDGKMYPLVTMEWVPGQTLYHWVDQQCRSRNSRSLQTAVDGWKELVDELVDAQIAHGDLQHGNVMVTEQNELKLVDYDCMCVPKLIGRRNLEIGVDPYQHPDRNGDTPLSQDLDNFSALFIFVALRALAASPNLWDDYVARHGYEKLLIRGEDLREPGQSELFAQFRRSSDTELSRLSDALLEFYRGDMSDVPNLRDVLFSYDRVRSLLSQHMFDEAVRLVENRGAASAIPNDLVRPIENARQRVDCLRQLKPCVDRGDESGMQQFYDSKLLHEYPAAQPYAAVAKDAARVIPLVAVLQQARQQRQWRQFVKSWDANRQLLDPRKSVQALKAELAPARQRNQLCDTILRAVEASAASICDFDALTRDWTELQRLGGHPEADRKQSAVARLRQLGQAWMPFQQALRQTQSLLSDANDKALVDTWRENLFQKWQPAEAHRPAIEAAQQRLRQVAKLKNLAGQPLSYAGEKQLFTLAANLRPPDYQHALLQRIRLARQRCRAVDGLNALLKGSAAEADLVAAWNALVVVQAESLAPPGAAARVKIAHSRVPILAELRQISLSLPPPQLDQRLLDAWRDDVLQHCAEADPWREAWARAVERRGLLLKLQQAHLARDKQTMADLASSPVLDGYPLPRDLGQAVADVQRQFVRARKLVAALRSNDSQAFREHFDPEVIRQAPNEFLPLRDRLTPWVKQFILPCSQIGLCPKVGAKSLQRKGSRYQASWTWPKKQYAAECMLTITQRTPSKADDPRSMPVIQRRQVSLKAYQDASGVVVHTSANMHHGYIAIWAVIDLGYETFTSEPLVLGRIDEPVKKNRRW